MSKVFCTIGLVVDLVKGYIEPGASWSAQVSWKVGDKANHGTYVASAKRLETWKMKIHHLDSHVKFDEEDPRRVFHNWCMQWLPVKEPGDTTRFKEHLQGCKVRLVPVGGTLTEMGWLKG